MGPPRCVEKEMGHFCLADDAWAVMTSESSPQQTLSCAAVVSYRVTLKVSLCWSLTRGTAEGFPCRYAE